MLTIPEIDWQGQSGKKYRFRIYGIDTDFKKLPGNYIFAKETKPRIWLPLYTGETVDLSDRFDDHHKMPCIKRNGGTHIHVHVNHSGKSSRLAVEADLIARWKPTCNGS